MPHDPSSCPNPHLGPCLQEEELHRVEAESAAAAAALADQLQHLRAQLTDAHAQVPAASRVAPALSPRGMARAGSTVGVVGHTHNSSTYGGCLPDV